MGWVINATPWLFQPMKQTRYLFQSRRGGLHVSVWRDAENITPLGLDRRTLQFAVSRYTDCCIPAHLKFLYSPFVVELLFAE
jgi:hypothetical protein